LAKYLGLPIDDDPSYYVNREVTIPTKNFGISPWRKYLFNFLVRNEEKIFEYYHLPTSKVIEIGSHISV